MESFQQSGSLTFALINRDLDARSAGTAARAVDRGLLQMTDRLSRSLGDSAEARLRKPPRRSPRSLELL